ncbi:MAG: cytochrome o ubiquinol oxidase subunit IV [Simkania sp.]|nr:cytochrome o ubiquinol oxidase subunit IV [Simkania sp.]
MKTNLRSTKPHEWAELGTFKSYFFGFLLSCILTVLAYFIVANHVFTGTAIIVTTLACALVQMLVQFIYFLHLGKESAPRWNIIVFLFMLLVMVILVFGSLWIMHHLNYQMMLPEEMEMHMHTHEGI